MFEEIDVLHDYLQLMKEETVRKHAHKQAMQTLHESVIDKYAYLADGEIQSLVIEDKWFASIGEAISGRIQQLAQELASRVGALGARYAKTLPELEMEARALSVTVHEHLRTLVLP